MADKSIDLLQPDELSSVEKRRVFYIRIGTIFLIVFYCLVAVAIFAFGLVVLRESQVVADKIELEKTRLSDLYEVESLQLLLKQRLSSLAKVVETDGAKPKYWLNYLDSLAPEGIAIEGTEWKSNGAGELAVELSGIAGNAVVLADFLNTLKQETDKEKIVSSTLVSATRQIEGVYDFNLEILVQKE